MSAVAIWILILSFFFPWYQIIALACTSACTSQPSGTDYVPTGYISSYEYWDDSFQDFTDYCEYYYDSDSAFENNRNYTEVTEDDLENIKGYYNYVGHFFEEFLEGEVNFNFNADTQVKAGDYVLIINENDETGAKKYDDFDVYYFDTDNNTLYYIHNNI